MDIERALETQRLRLLRLVAGLLAAVVFVSVGPFSHAWSRWIGGSVLSILSRAEAAAQCLVIVQARLIAARTGSDVDLERLLESRTRNNGECEDAGSHSTLRERLELLRALLEELPRHGLRLLRRVEKAMRRAACVDQPAPCPDALVSAALWDWRLGGTRIERPPDIPAAFGADRFPGCCATRSGALLVRGFRLAGESPGPARQHCMLHCIRGSESIIAPVRVSH